MTVDITTGADTYGIHLPSGHVGLVDAFDRDLVDAYRWNALVRPHTTYVIGWPRVGPCKPVQMLHRVLMNAPKGLDVDHIDRDGLNNRRSNLRIATRGQNIANSGTRRDNTSGYRGVTWHKLHRKWHARLQLPASGRVIYVGSFDDPWEAAQAWNAAALREWGEFARLNVRRTNN